MQMCETGRARVAHTRSSILPWKTQCDRLPIGYYCDLQQIFSVLLYAGKTILIIMQDHGSDISVTAYLLAIAMEAHGSNAD